MNKKILLLSAFIIVALVQLYVPAKMIIDREVVLRTGNDYKFESAPIDPSDPFRGEYITLSFNNRVEVYDTTTWRNNSPVYALVTTNKKGYAEITSLTKEKPKTEQDYFETKVRYSTGKNPQKVVISYPFDRYYMEETTALEAELTYTESVTDTSQVAYALVSIKNGKAVLKDVMIDGVSIKDIVKELNN